MTSAREIPRFRPCFQIGDLVARLGHSRTMMVVDTRMGERADVVMCAYRANGQVKPIELQVHESTLVLIVRAPYRGR